MMRHLLGLLLLGTLLAILAVTSLRGTLPGDVEVAQALSGLGGALAPISRLASLPVWTGLVVVIAGVLWWFGRPRAGLVLLVAVVLAEAASYILKELIARPRPTAGVTDLGSVTASFPSSSVVRVTVMLGVVVASLAWRRPAWRVPAVAGTVLFLAVLGLARIASGEHWPSDVIAGYLLGGFWLEAVAAIATYQSHRRGPAHAPVPSAK
jgi:undecaprenyl-diphosphatase